MRRRMIRTLVIVSILVILGVGYSFFSVHFSGDGKETPEEALPSDANYEWIVGPKSEKEQRYFFLSNGDTFGTEVISKNFKGWSSGDGTSTPLPKPLEDNTINAGYSDSNILFGLIKPNGDVKITVNNHPAEQIPLTSLSAEIAENYNVAGYEIWYIDLSALNDSKNYVIRVLDKNDSLLSELSI
ncbi:hypothetical protein [Ureibacillus aquaedulcis]|uniref:Uncharacterized protein n=1 Tax=Ureibacillus aquaedulcis TaxID=3058421 RepID=A0ABT8GM23_9BACL|nr:hypothetical protein [Ureibacillus sp. BA0131]MDN4492473.1 hypothetical protein [Ureibacillus sp. BA0131]